MPDTPTALTVSEVNRRACQALESSFDELWVEGELSGVARPASGHLYFTLKDARAQLRCALFRTRARFVAAPMRDGDRVRVRGRLSLFEPRGDYQLIAEAVQAAGVGELLAAFEALKSRLAAEGIFTNARPLPCPPRHLLVLTSPTGAALRDVLAVLAARWPLAQVTLIPVPVQGHAAAPAVIAALGLLNRQPALDPAQDAVLITRGGGSLEDLWAFNDEHLARAIHHSRLPVMSAVGHEVDITLADHAADVRAPTPSAAAERLVPDQRELRDRLTRLERRLCGAARGRLERESQRLDRLGGRLRHPDEVLARRRAALAQLQTRLLRAQSVRLTHERQRLAAVARALQAVSPLAVLERGYAILEDEHGQVVRRTGDVVPGQSVTASLGDGRLTLKVTSTT